MPQKTTSRLLLKKDDMIVFEGDSITSRVMNPAKDTWPYLRLMHWERSYADDVSEFLFANLPQLGLGFHNIAIGGSNCRRLLERLETLLLPLKPNWVILTIGNNDPAHSVTLPEFERSMTTYARRIAETTGGRCMFVGGFVACPNLVDPHPEKYLLRRPYYAILRKVAARYRGVFVDVGQPMLRKSTALLKQYSGHTIYSDGPHLNPLGNLMVATEVIKGLGYDWQAS